MSLETAFIMLQSPHPVRQEDAADALWTHAHLNDAMKVAIREAGAIPLLVELLESCRSADARRSSAGALANIAHENAENKVAIREAGAIPPLLALVEFGGAYSRPMSVDALRMLTHNNEDNAVATALARGRVEAIVELARRGSVTIRTKLWGNPFEVVVQNAGAGAKRKAALVVAKLFRDCVEFPAPYDIKVAIASFLQEVTLGKEHPCYNSPDREPDRESYSTLPISRTRFYRSPEPERESYSRNRTRFGDVGCDRT